MKGMLTKDLLIIGQQKRLLVLYALLAVIMSMSMDAVFLVCYFPLVAVIVALSTIAYDSYDNGMAFLMTMPGVRKHYVAEKYLLSAMMMLASWAVAIVLQMWALLVKGIEFTVVEALIQDTIFLPVFILVSAVMIPITLKYGAEKGRLVSFIVMAVVILLVLGGGSLMGRISASMGRDTRSIIQSIENIPGPMVAAVLAAVTLLILLISIKISSGIMKKKEF